MAFWKTEPTVSGCRAVPALLLFAVAAEGPLTVDACAHQLLAARYPVLQVVFLRFGIGLLEALLGREPAGPGYARRRGAHFWWVRS